MSYYVGTLKNFYRLMRNLRMTKEDLVKYQNRCLSKVVRHAYDTVPFYRRKFDAVGLNPDKIKTVEDLSRLPIISKSDIRQNADDFISSDYPKESLRDRKSVV